MGNHLCVLWMKFVFHVDFNNIHKSMDDELIDGVSSSVIMWARSTVILEVVVRVHKGMDADKVLFFFRQEQYVCDDL